MGVTTSPGRMLRPADCSALLTVRGVASWGAIVIAVVFTGGGMLLSHALGSSATGWLFAVCTVLGVALAAVAVRRGSIFTAMVQAPIVVTVMVFLGYALFGTGSSSTKSTVVTSGIQVVTNFPVMAVATGVGLLLGLVRIIAQPIRHPGTPSAPRSYGYSRGAAHP